MLVCNSKREATSAARSRRRCLCDADADADANAEICAELASRLCARRVDRVDPGDPSHLEGTAPRRVPSALERSKI